MARRFELSRVAICLPGERGWHIHQGGAQEASVDEPLLNSFNRGQAARSTTFGTGMGLSITRGLLMAAGGRIWAENIAGGGARFSIRVPGPVRTAAVVT